MPKISIIIPVYNAEMYLEKCLKSIVNQTLKDIEIIVINDGSTDNSKKIMNEYASKDARIIILDIKNQGPSKVRNLGIKIAKGKYIGFVDSDDYIELDMYEALYNLIGKNEVAMCNYNMVDVLGNKINKISSNLKYGHSYSKNEILEDIVTTFTEYECKGFFSLCNKIYSNEFLKKNKFFIDEKRDHGEDWLFNINIFLKLNSFITIDKYFYNYVQHNKNSLMNKYRKEQFDLFLESRNQIISIIPERFINYYNLNKNFIYEFSVYVIRTNKENISKKDKKVLIDKVINNQTVLECCSKSIKLPIHFAVPVFFLKNNMKSLAKASYKIISLIV